MQKSEKNLGKGEKSETAPLEKREKTLTGDVIMY